ncbi:MAG: HD domain-containing phosphohydrolase [Candidatus Omnitrophota bacterium]
MMNDKRTRVRLVSDLANLRRIVPKTESLLEGVLVMDFKGNVLYYNKSAASMFGLKSQKDGLGQSVLRFVLAKYRKAVIENMRRIAKGEWGFLAPYKVRSLSGREFWVESLGQKINYKNVPAELVVLRDITDRKEMEFALRKAKAEVEREVKDRTSELKLANDQLMQEILERKKAERGLKDNYDKFKRLFKATISSLASAVEAKDPYTAGHQRRVTQLACAIAEEMSLEKERIEGLYMASIIHDIGKIHIPAEILSRPGVLSDLEFDMIKTHAQFGYNILKSIEFPWPVARIVLQHHEKINGSGYPLGLAGADILIEAKILMVADVVEAISSYRPYRPALGMDKALNEIATNKGIKYDPDAVNACLTVINKKKFRFDPTIEQMKPPRPTLSMFL